MAHLQVEYGISVHGETAREWKPLLPTKAIVWLDSTTSTTQFYFAENTPGPLVRVNYRTGAWLLQDSALGPPQAVQLYALTPEAIVPPGGRYACSAGLSQYLGHNVQKCRASLRLPEFASDAELELWLARDMALATADSLIQHYDVRQARGEFGWPLKKIIRLENQALTVEMAATRITMGTPPPVREKSAVPFAPRLPLPPLPE